MKKAIKKYVKKCIFCKRNKSNYVAPMGLFQALSIPHRVWEDVSTDFINGLPSLEGLIEFV